MKLLQALLLIAMVIPTVCATVPLEAVRLVGAARAELETRSSGMPGDWEFVAAGDLTDSQVQEGDVKIEAESPEGHWPRGRVGVPVHVWIEGRPLQTRMVWFTVRRWMEVPVYARNAHAGELLDQVPMQLQRRDMAAFFDRPVFTAAGGRLVPLQLKHSVRAGQPVMQDDFRPSPEVSRHQLVELTVRRGAVILSTQALAQEDGLTGEPVKVLPNGATELVTARVAGRNEVTIEE